MLEYKYVMPFFKGANVLMKLTINSVKIKSIIFSLTENN